MAVFKCKMCGGDLEVAEEQYIAECEYCGTKQTVPGSRDENMRALYNRANNLRVACEFDKAAEIYEKIVSSDEEQSEAYFGLVLCKYGIEYVEDPRTFKRIPTCHRCSYDVASLDPNFKSAVKHAHITQRELYEVEVKKIDELQRDILARVNDGDKYDVFICYKETDENGKRTHDSVIANDIYHELKDAGLRVFYAAITLEGKLGSAYEPIIFSALNTAKVMLVIGTRPEYFNAVWVKNEWSRFLRLMDNDRSRLLIPCYRDMDAYDMPREFAHLQAQDMGKIGFINDVVRGIKKVIGTKKTEKEATRVDTSYQQPASSNAANLIVRAKMALEDDEFSDAISFADQALNVEATLAEAYLIRFLAENDTKTLDELLKKCDTKVVTDTDYKRASRFATGELAETLRDFENKVYIEECKPKYARADWLINNFDDVADYHEAKRLIDECGCYQPCQELLPRLEKAYEKFKKDEHTKDCMAKHSRAKWLTETLASDGDYNEARRLIEECGDYQPCQDLLPVLEEKYECYKKVRRVAYFMECETKYTKAKWLAENIKRERDYFDAKQLIKECIDYPPCADLMPVLEEKYAEFLEDQRIKKEKEAEARRVAEEEEKKKLARQKKIKKICIISIISIIVLVIALAITLSIMDSNTRNGIKYTLVGDEYRVSGVDNVNLTSATILSEYNGKPVTSIGSSAFENCRSLTSIMIPDSVTSIGNCAFENCTSLTSITIPESVTSIGYSAFSGCTSLTSITIPEGVASIESTAFKNCRSLTSITIPKSVTSIGYSAFSSCTSLTSITIPDSLTSIGGSAFYYCEDLTSITIPDSVTSIGEWAFSYCTSLKSITIPESVTSIGDDAFYNCTSLTSITIPNSVTSIGEYAFYYCTSLASITIPDSVRSIGNSAFYNCTSLKTIKYRGTKEQWNEITKGSYWNLYTGNYTITYNYTGE